VQFYAILQLSLLLRGRQIHIPIVEIFLHVGYAWSLNAGVFAFNLAISCIDSRERQGARVPRGRRKKIAIRDGKSGTEAKEHHPRAYTRRSFLNRHAHVLRDERPPSVSYHIVRAVWETAPHPRDRGEREGGCARKERKRKRERFETRRSSI